MTLTSTGAFLIPASLPGTLVVDFIQAHKLEAYTILKDVKRYHFQTFCMHALTEGLLAKPVYCNYDNEGKNDNGVALNNNIHCSSGQIICVCAKYDASHHLIQ